MVGSDLHRQVVLEVLDADRIIERTQGCLLAGAVLVRTRRDERSPRLTSYVVTDTGRSALF
jgi:hypothetical protein